MHIIIIMEICKAPTLRLKALDKTGCDKFYKEHKVMETEVSDSGAVQNVD